MAALAINKIHTIHQMFRRSETLKELHRLEKIGYLYRSNLPSEDAQSSRTIVGARPFMSHSIVNYSVFCS